MTSLVASPSIQLVNGLPVVSSLTVAEHFEKRHERVLDSIRKTASECVQEFAEHNFVLSEYQDNTGRSLPLYLLTRDGFSLIVMGFTGKKALAWKVRYIEAFNAMEGALLKNRQKALAAPAPTPKEALLCIHSKSLQLKHDLLELEMAVTRLYGNRYCAVRRNVRSDLRGYVSEEDTIMHSLLQTCTYGLRALHEAVENRMVQMM